MFRIYTTEIQGDQCIGDSLEILNDNFLNLDTATQNNTQPDYVLPIATKGSNGVLGGVRVGGGLDVNLNGVVSIKTPYTFGEGLIADENNYVTLQYDPTALTIRDGVLNVLKSEQETWVVGNSARLNQEVQLNEQETWIINNSATLMKPFAGDGVYEVIIFDYNSVHTDVYIEPVIGGVNNDVVLTPGYHVYNGDINFTIYSFRYPDTYSVTVDGIPHYCSDGVNTTISSLQRTSYTLTITNTRTRFSYTFNITMGQSNQSTIILQ